MKKINYENRVFATITLDVVWHIDGSNNFKNKSDKKKSEKKLIGKQMCRQHLLIK